LRGAALEAASGGGDTLDALPRQFKGCPQHEAVLHSLSKKPCPELKDISYHICIAKMHSYMVNGLHLRAFPVHGLL
jgi:hypothetical protein